MKDLQLHCSDTVGEENSRGSKMPRFSLVTVTGADHVYSALQRSTTF